jgi:hypothetical protein
MKFQKLFGVFLMAATLMISGLTQAKAQDQAQTPVPTQVSDQDQTQAQPKHHHKKMDAAPVDPSDISGRIDALEQQNQALQDRLQNLESNAFSSPALGSQAAMPAQNPKNVDEDGWNTGVGMHNAATDYIDANEYTSSESRYIAFSNPSGDMRFRIGGYMFADAELNFQPASVYLDNNYNSQSSVGNFNGFLAAKAHLSFDGLYDKMFGMSIGIESDKSTSVSIGFFHAYAFAKIDPGFEVIMGKYTNPLSLEGLQPSADLPFMSASMVSDLVPNKDIGIMAVGSFSHMMDYAVDVANGEQDNESSATGPGKSTDQTKAITARTFFTPWKKSHDEDLKDLGFGIGGSWDNEINGDTAIWSKLETSLGGNTVASYAAAVVPKGDFWHWDPQMYYYNGQFGLQAEMVQSIQTVGYGNLPTVTLTNTAWMAEVSWVFGGKPTFEGPIVDNEFDLSKGHFGALEFVARFHQLNLDGNSFLGTASGANFAPGPTTGLATGAQVSTAYGLAVNWWLNTHFKTQFDLERTDFSGGTLSVVSEQVFYTRMAFIL